MDFHMNMVVVAVVVEDKNLDEHCIQLHNDVVVVDMVVDVVVMTVHDKL